MQSNKSMYSVFFSAVKHLHNNAIHLARRLQVAHSSSVPLRAGDRERSTVSNLLFLKGST